MTLASKTSSLHNLGKLVLTRGVADFIATGVLPYEQEPNPLTLGADWRRHWLSISLISHAEGCWGDTCLEDAALNDEVYNSPAHGGRLMSVWHRSNFPKLWIITSDFKGPHCYTTALWPDEY